MSGTQLLGERPGAACPVLELMDADGTRLTITLPAATHLEVAALGGSVPARVRRPGDKAKVEQGVLLAERWPRVHPDYHVEVEILRGAKRIESHFRRYEVGKHSTVTEHMPKGPREYVGWTPTRLIDWAKKFGPATSKERRGGSAVSFKEYFLVFCFRFFQSGGSGVRTAGFRLTGRS